MAREIVIIGSGGAGMTAASTARRTDPDAKITVITEDTDIAYSSCVIPWAIEGKVSWKSAVMHTPEFYSKNKRINVLAQTKAETVNDETKTVSAGGKTYRYDSLIIATGAKVFMPPIKGTDLEGVFVVRTINDGKNIQSFSKNIKKAVVCGAGVIGLEMALSLLHLGKDVTVIEMFDQVIPRMADKDIASTVQEYLESKGVKFILNTPVQSVNGTNKVSGVTAGSKEYSCEMVIFATGIKANTDLPKQLGFDIGQLGGVVVSPSLQPFKKGVPVENVYLAGDVIQCESAVVAGPTLSQLGSSAVRQGRVAGINAAGGNAIYGPVASPWVSVVGDVEIAGTGLSSGLASWYKVPVVSGKAEGLTRARYYPGAKMMVVKVLADATTHRLVGAQIIAGEGTTGRINWLTTAIISKITAEEFLVRAENAYCPPTSMVKDVVFSAVEDLCNNFEAQ